MELKKRQEDAVAQITSTEVSDDGVSISALSDMGRYGKVRFTLNLESSGDRSEGLAHVAGSFTGRWAREGTKVVVHGIDHVSNGDLSLLRFEFDAIENELTLANYALN